ncbi:MAG: RNA polymerase factor sigma-32 [Deltaproteobacteria bacterium]|nr:RNA polymerase factor sigma-32 [Deltaproteobacteria bacterium]
MYALTRTNDITLYMNEINRYPLLTQEEEFDLAVRLREYGDREAAERLATSNLRFVVKIANEYRNYGLKLMDLVQEGNIGLLMAVKKFNPHKGYRLLTYAVWWIKAYIQEFIIKNWSLVKIGTTQAQKKLFYKLNQAKEKLARGDDYKAIAESLDVREGDVEEMDLRMSARDFSLDSTIDDEGTTTHMDLLPCNKANQEEIVADAQEKAVIKKDVADVVSSMKERDRFIIEKRLMADEPMTLQEVGDHLGVSRERARQLEARIKKNLKESLCQKQLTWNS